MDQKKMFEQVRQLCLACGVGIDRIAKECGINQNLVAEMFMKTMRSILDQVKERTNDKS